MQQEFEKAHFSLENTKVHKWFNTQRERLRAFQPELTEYFICEKILKQCPGTLEHAVKSRFKGEASTMSFEEMLIILEDVLERFMRYHSSTYSSPNNNNSPQYRSAYPSNKLGNPNSEDPKKPQVQSLPYINS